MGAAEVHFQDFNREVLEDLTAGNVQANLLDYRRVRGLNIPGADTNDELQTNFRYFCGDWQDLAGSSSSPWPSQEYDIILSSETIYSIDAQEKLYQLILRVSFMFVTQQPDSFFYNNAKPLLRYGRLIIVFVHVTSRSR